MSFVTLLSVASVACQSSAPSAPVPEFRPSSTVRDIMESIVDPAADGIWDSVEIVATLEGTEEKRPRTDEDWQALRHHAVSLVEASNLLLIPGRSVARPGEKADDPNADLHPEEVEAAIAKYPEAWGLRALDLHGAATETLAAIDAKDVPKLLDAGDVLDRAGESCHRAYWYRPGP
jgi:hypothetical protein